MSSRRLIALAACLLAAVPACAGDTVALLSQGGGAYMEAFSAFQAAYGGEVKYFDVSRRPADLPPGTRTVVAFGGRAAGQEIPPGVNLVYCLTPGLFLKRGGEARTVKVALIPTFDVIVAAFKKFQPSLRRLQVFWMVQELGAFSELAKAEGLKIGVEILPVKVDDLDDLPALLRRTLGKADAFWLPPDPLLISPESIMIFREFSAGNRMPFYTSSKWLTRDGATASVGVSFQEVGSAAAAAVRAVEAGTPQPPIVFPLKAEIAVNASAAQRAGLQITSEALREADYVYP